MLPNTTRTTYAGSLLLYNANSALLQLTDTTQNVWCLPETAKPLSVFKVTAPSRHLPAYCVYLRKYVTKNIIRLTVHPEFLIPHAKPQLLFGNIEHIFLHRSSGSFSSGRGGGKMDQRRQAQATSVWRCKNRQKENRATEDLIVTSKRKLQHGVDSHDVRKNIVTNFADTSNRWLHLCIS